VPALTSSTLLDLDFVPRHLIVIGGSYIGLEFAQTFRRFGAAVTVVEKEDRLIAREDYDISTAIVDIFEKEGIVIRTTAECVRLEGNRSGIAVGVDCVPGPRKNLGDTSCVTGRRPNTDDLGLRLPAFVDDGGLMSSMRS
jgi:pyruvate/2-oxoglutarate dehydrogenase complex dihydrolipoamide dehydrogenase (E3) component